MAAPRVLVLRSPGANCDEETAQAFQLARGLADRVHVNRLLEEPALLEQYQIFCIPGGFSYGDDVGAGRVLGNQLRLRLSDAFRQFRDDGKLILGICNGFQVLMKTGLLDSADEAGPHATLTWNDHGRYEARWVHLATSPGDCVFLQGMGQIEMPIAHAEGKIVLRDAAALEKLATLGRIVLQYADEEGQTSASGELPFPLNPNGSTAGAAGLCDATGRVLGLMPHPERFIDATQHPNWTRQGKPAGKGAGLQLFENAVNYFC